MAEGSKNPLVVLPYSLLHLALVSILGQLLLLGFGGVFELLEGIGFTFTYRGKPVESLILFTFFYYFFRMPEFQLPAIIITVFSAIVAFILGRLCGSIPHSFAFGALSPVFAILILCALSVQPFAFMAFAFSYSYFSLQSLICAVFATIGAYSSSPE